MWLKLNNYLENVLNLRKFWIFLLNILYLYLIVYVFFYLAYLLIIWKPLIFNIILMLILLVGLSIDSRFTKKAVLIMLVLIIIQIVVYNYLNMIPILIIKDMFWFSVVMNVAFIWHICILQWVYKVAELMKWELLKYITRSLGVLTSLTWWIWIMNWIDFIIYRIEQALLYGYLPAWDHSYDDMIKYYSKKYPKLKDKELEYKMDKKFKSICITTMIIKYIMGPLRSIIFYFMRIFHNYCMFMQVKRR